MSIPADHREELVLVFALFGGDAEITQSILTGQGIHSELCPSIDVLCGSIERGAGAVMLTEESLKGTVLDRLIDVLREQASWSDLPIIVSVASAGHQRTHGALDVLGIHGNVSLLERPVRIRGMLAAIRNALRARRRQYRTRDLLREVATSEERFRQVQERSPYGLVLFRPLFDASGDVKDFECMYLNAASERHLRAPAEQLRGTRLLDYLSDLELDGDFGAFVAALKTNSPVTRELSYRRGAYECVFRSTAFRLEDNLAIVFEDVTEQKRSERERMRLLALERDARAEAEALNRSKDEFVATVSHELRTPLNAMLGWARMLSSGKLEGDKSRRAIEAIERNALAQAQLIDDLLDISRIISGKLRLDLDAVDFPKIIEAAIESIRPALEAKEIRLVTAVEPLTNQVVGDPNRLQQVAWNLLSNAIKFTPRRGQVQLTLRRVESQVELTVADNGQGIDPTFLPLLFQRFRQADGSSTRRHGGLGLGLAICRHLVELHGGTIDAMSEGLGCGALFRVRLPLQPSRPNAAFEQRLHPTLARKVTLECPPEVKGLRVLIVDDQPDARELLGAVLSECGAITIEAASASEALDLVSTQRPDVIVSDIGMPGEDGYSFIRSVRALEPNRGGRTPAAALTAYARVEDRRQAMKAGFEMHLPKPVEPSEFLTVLATLARIGRAMSA